jgi:hypothetical protein
MTPAICRIEVTTAVDGRKVHAQIHFHHRRARSEIGYAEKVAAEPGGCALHRHRAGLDDEMRRRIVIPTGSADPAMADPQASHQSR